MTQTIDHMDPIWFSGEKEEADYEQLICGLDIPANHRVINISDNSVKADRFLPWRVEGDTLPPCDRGDMAWFLIKDQWVWTEFLGNEWFAETKRQGRFHQARQGRASAARRDGFIGWRDRQDDETRREFDHRRTDAVKAAIKSGKRWGFMDGLNQITDESLELRMATQIIQKDGVTIVCESGVPAKQIAKMAMDLFPDDGKLSSGQIYRVWRGRTAKGWTLV